MASDPKQLREYRGSYTVTYRELLRLASDGPSRLLGVVEGRDSPYYLPRLEDWITIRAIPLALKLVRAKGKDNVLKVREAVDKNDSLRSKFIFFVVDRDFSGSNLARIDTYVTPGYSVESYYLSWSFISKVILHEILVGESSAEIDELLEKISKFYDSAVGKFISEIDHFHYWVMAQRISYAKRVDISKYDKASFCTVELSSNGADVSIMDFKPTELGDNEFHPSTDEVNSLRLESEGINFSALRGKQGVAFVLAFLAAAIDWLRKKLSEDDVFVGKLDVGFKSLVSRLAGYADSPPCLFEFMDNFWEQRNG